MSDPNASPENPQRSKVQLIVTIVLLVLFGVLLCYMLASAAGASETTWQRRIYVLGVAQAIVFTAVGWLFGREVYRVEATTARAEAAQATNEAKAAQAAAETAGALAAEQSTQAAVERTKSQALSGAVRNLAGAATGSTEQGGARPVSLGTPREGEAAALSALLGMVDVLWAPGEQPKP